MKLRNCLYGIAVIIAAITDTTVLAESIQSHNSIREAAEAFIINEVGDSMGTQPSAKSGHLDSRLRLPSCNEPLDTFLPAGSRTLGNTTVGVRCSGTKSWTLYVPVNVSIYEIVVVAARPLTKGRIVQEQDLKLIEKDLSRLRSGYFTSISEVAGKQALRSVITGTPVTTLMVKDPLQIKRGQQIDIVAVAKGLEVRMKGKALADGATGEHIQVRNESTRKVVEGIVISATTVQVNM